MSKNYKNINQIENRDYRVLAVKLLYKVIYEGAFSNLALDQELRRTKFNNEERARTTALFYGSLSRYKFLIAISSKISSRNIGGLDNIVICILITALYELFFMHTAIYACVNEFVNICKFFKVRSASSLINAILRKSSCFSDDIESLAKDLSPEFRYSIDKNLYKDLVISMGENTCKEFLLRAYKSAPMSFRFRGSEIEYENYLKKHSHVFRPSLISSDFLVLQAPFSEIPKEDIFKTLMPQGELAGLAVKVLDPQPREAIGDFCAAPGNKSLQIQDYRNGDGELFCYDVHQSRVNLIVRRFEEAGEVENIGTKVFPTKRDMRENINQDFDRILLDVPCSSYGMLTHKPELRYKYDEDSLSELIGIQSDLLESAAKSLRSGGVLVYSTCTLRIEENEMQVRKFLEKHPEFSLFPFEDPRLCSKKHESAFLSLLPDEKSSEGFFIARMKRN